VNYKKVSSKKHASQMSTSAEQISSLYTSFAMASFLGLPALIKPVACHFFHGTRLPCLPPPYSLSKFLTHTLDKHPTQQGFYKVADLAAR
jgi:hypothetical protein